jgi:phage tail tape-measure protein
LFSGLRGNIFLLGEIGDAARTVKEILFGWQKPLIEAEQDAKDGDLTSRSEQERKESAGLPLMK